MSLEEPSVYFALAAIGSCLRGQARSLHLSLIRLVNRSTNLITLDCYSKSLRYRRLRGATSCQENAHIEPILVTAFLFMVLESLLWHNRSAERHIRFGSAIERASRDRQLRLAPSSEVSHLARMFELVLRSSTSEPVASSFCPGAETEFISDPGKTVRPPELDVLSAHIDELAEESSRICAELVRLSQDQLMAKHKLSDGLCDSMLYCLAHCLSRIVNLAHHNELRERLKALQHTHALLRKGLTSRRSEFARCDKSRFLLLQIRFFSSYFAITTCRDMEETLTDRFQSSFIEVLHYSEEVLENRWRKRANGTDGPPDLESNGIGLLGWGILPALFSICCKCRDPTIRKQAIRLLRTYRWREGHNESRTLAFYAEIIMALEEKKAMELYTGVSDYVDLPKMDIPEKARFLDVVFSADADQPGVLTIICVRIANDSRSRIELLEYQRSVPVEIQSIGSDLCLVQDSEAECNEPLGCKEQGVSCTQRFEIEVSSLVTI